MLTVLTFLPHPVFPTRLSAICQALLSSLFINGGAAPE